MWDDDPILPLMPLEERPKYLREKAERARVLQDVYNALYPTGEVETVVVTRHPALVAYLVEVGLVQEGVKVVTHADSDTVRNKHVVGVLPLRLAALAAAITEVPLSLPPELRGIELTLEQIRKYAGETATYAVIRKEV